MPPYFTLKEQLKAVPESWLVTGGAGFIGSHVVEELVSMGQRVRILDNLSTGQLANLTVTGALESVDYVQGDIRDPETCATAVAGMDRVIHLAAMGSVPISMEQPQLCHDINVTGTLQVFLASKEAGVKQIAYASSSAVYGDDPAERKSEETIGKALSPYAASKRMNEIHAQTLHDCYGLRSVGLRFFNVFGPRQDPNGAYAAVIPQWIAAMKEGRAVYINGDGENSRDFCFVKDIVQALLLAATTENPAAAGDVFNVGLGKATSLNELFGYLSALVTTQTGQSAPAAIYRDFRAGDIRHSCAATVKMQAGLGFTPDFNISHGLTVTTNDR